MADPIPRLIPSDFTRGLTGEKYNFEIKIKLIHEHFLKVWPTTEDLDDTFYRLMGPHFAEMTTEDQMRLVALVVERAGQATMLRGKTETPEPK